MYISRIKFYADTPKGEKNKFFCFIIYDLDIIGFIRRFWLKGFNIRAAYYETIDDVTREVKYNKKINLMDVFDKN